MDTPMVKKEALDSPVDGAKHSALSEDLMTVCPKDGIQEEVVEKDMLVFFLNSLKKQISIKSQWYASVGQ